MESASSPIAYARERANPTLKHVLNASSALEGGCGAHITFRVAPLEVEGEEFAGRKSRKSDLCLIASLSDVS